MANKFLESIFNSQVTEQKSDEIRNLPTHVSNVINSFRNPNLITDPTTIGFRIFFHFGDNNGLLADSTFVNSAEKYFERTGQIERRDILKKFKAHLSMINSTFHFLYKSVDGLEDVLNLRPGAKPDQDTRLNISTLETIDWKIQVLNELYQNIVYDMQRGIEVLPENLRRFSMSIYIYDAVILHEAIALNTNNAAPALIAPTAATVNDIPSNKHIMLDFSGCEFDPHQSGREFYSGVNNAEADEAKNNISIKYMKAARSSLFLHIIGETPVNDKSLDFAKAALSRNPADRNKFNEVFKTLASPFYKAVEDLKDKYPNLQAVKTAVNTYTKDLAQFALNQGINALNARINRLFLGNIYELDPADLLRISRSESFLEQFANMNSAINDAKKGFTGGRYDRANDRKREPIPPRNVYAP